MRMLTLMFTATVLLLPVAGQGQTAERPWADLTVLVTGANRGLGLEFARQLHASGATVIATARRPEAAQELHDLGVRVMQLDVADAASVEALAAGLDGQAIDVLLNNAGIFLARGGLEGADLDEALRVYEVNTVGPMRVTQALLENLRSGRRKLIMNMSSGLGSIASNARGGSLGYRESKSALNMFTRTLAAELGEEGFTCIAMSPGWVRTDMGGDSAPLGADESVGGMLAVLAAATPADNGRFLDHQGEELPW